MNICAGQNVSAEEICTRVPSGITQSPVFVVDLEAVQFEDLTVDDNGVYRAHSSPSEHFKVFQDDQGKISGLSRIVGLTQKSKEVSSTHMIIATSEDNRAGVLAIRTSGV